MESTRPAALPAPAPSVVTIATVVYALHAVSLGIGAFTAATVVGQFLFGWPSILAVILNYLKRSDARGTWVESHFDWQIRTFWLSLAFAVAIGLISLPLVILLGLGILTWWAGLFVLGVWACFRIARGWLRLRDGQTVGLP